MEKAPQKSIALSKQEAKQDDETDKKDPPYKIFGVAKHTSHKVYHIWKKKFCFNYPISSLSTLAFTFGYLDCEVYSKYGFMCTMQTANMIFLADNMFPKNNEYYAIETNVPILIVNFLIGTLGGCFLSLYLLETTQNRKITFGILITILCAMCLVVDFTCYYKMPVPDPTSHYNGLVLLLSIPASAIFHWSSKLGYLLNLMTGNIMKVADALYRRMRSYPQGGATLRGDILTLCIIIIAYFLGGVFCSLIRASFNDGDYAFALLPLACSWPFQLWQGGVLSEIGINIHVWDSIEEWYHWSLEDEHEDKLLNKLRPTGVGRETVLTEDGTKATKSDNLEVGNSDNSNLNNSAASGTTKAFSVQMLSKKHHRAIVQRHVSSKFVHMENSDYNTKEDALYTLHSKFHRESN